MNPALLELQAMADALMPVGVVAVCRDANGIVDELFAAERIAVDRAVARRQAEFSAGRSAARAALNALGQPAVCIPVGPDRAPVWPQGYTGSISHCDAAAIAIASRLDASGCHLGIDIEEAVGVEPELWQSICRPREFDWLDAALDPALRVKTLFSIKEAVYKAQFPVTRTLLDFHDVEIVAFDASGNFNAHILVGTMKKVTGRVRASDHFILAFASAQDQDD